MWPWESVRREVCGGPLWLSQQIDGNHGWEDNEAIAECKELTDVALQMKKILIALMQSLENGGKEVPVEGCCI